LKKGGTVVVMGRTLKEKTSRGSEAKRVVKSKTENGEGGEKV